MTDHAALLKQIRKDARPYVEQALDLAEVFTGFRKLASENGLDWGVIKQLIKAELQDEKEGGSEKVSRIIEKADFASAYADMLGLKMNENNFSMLDFGKGGGHLNAPAPPHDPSTGELIEEPTRSHAKGVGGALAPSAEGGINALKGDVGEDHGRDSPLAMPDASPINSNAPHGVASEPATNAIEQVTAGSQINSELFTPGWSTDPQINRERCAEAGLCADRALDGSISGDETTERIPGTTTGGRDVCPLDRSLLVTAGETAPFPDLPPRFDRRSKAA